MEGRRLTWDVAAQTIPQKAQMLDVELQELAFLCLFLQDLVQSLLQVMIFLPFERIMFSLCHVVSILYYKCMFFILFSLSFKILP